MNILISAVCIGFALQSPIQREEVKFTESEAKFLAKLAEHEDYYRLMLTWLAIGEVASIPKPGANPKEAAAGLLAHLAEEAVRPKNSDDDLDKVVQGFSNIVLASMHDELVLFLLGNHPTGKPSTANLGYFKKLDERILNKIR